MIEQDDRLALELIFSLFGYRGKDRLCDNCLTYYCAYIIGVTGGELAFYETASCSTPAVFGLFMKELKVMYEESGACNISRFYDYLRNHPGCIDKILARFSLASHFARKIEGSEALPPIHPN